MNSDALLLALVDEALDNGDSGVQRLAIKYGKEQRRRYWTPFKGARHAPPGGITLGGVYYRGGSFIPAAVIAHATDEEKLALRSDNYIAVIRLPDGEFVTADEGEPVEADIEERAEALNFPESMVVAFIALPHDAKIKAVWYDAKRDEHTIPPMEEAAGQQNLALHRFSSTQFNLADCPGPLPDGQHAWQKVCEMAESIPDEDLAEDGRELQPHITILFGL